MDIFATLCSDMKQEQQIRNVKQVKLKPGSWEYLTPDHESQSE